ncbi:hypothetical protein LTR95_011013 [Oleoguttula sp. CCFEE 5521]
MAMVGDGQTAYDSGNDGKANELAGCSARGIRNVDFPTRLKVTYFQDKELTVDLLYKKEDEWTRCFQIPNTKLPAVSYLGFSAETGELSDNHDIVSVETRNLYSISGRTGTPPAGTKDYSRGKYKTDKSASSGSWFWFFDEAEKGSILSKRVKESSIAHYVEKRAFKPKRIVYRSAIVWTPTIQSMWYVGDSHCHWLAELPSHRMLNF